VRSSEKKTRCSSGRSLPQAGIVRKEEGTKKREKEVMRSGDLLIFEKGKKDRVCSERRGNLGHRGKGGSEKCKGRERIGENHLALKKRQRRSHSRSFKREERQEDGDKKGGRKRPFWGGRKTYWNSVPLEKADELSRRKEDRPRKNEPV